MKADAEIKVLSTYLIGAMIEAKSVLAPHSVLGSFPKTEVVGFLQSKATPPLFFKKLKTEHLSDVFRSILALMCGVTAHLGLLRRSAKRDLAGGFIFCSYLIVNSPSSSLHSPAHAAQRQCLSDKVLVLTKDT